MADFIIAEISWYDNRTGSQTLMDILHNTQPAIIPDGTHVYTPHALTEPGYPEGGNSLAFSFQLQDTADRFGTYMQADRGIAGTAGVKRHFSVRCSNATVATGTYQEFLDWEEALFE